MLSESKFKEMYIAYGHTDLRYGIDGLATTVKEKFGLNPFSPNTIFLFCGTVLKLLYGKEMASYCCINAWKQVH